VEIPEIGQPVLGDPDLVPGLPYKQIRVHIRGIGYYHDIGKFICDLENKYPHLRVINLALEPASQADNSSEKLAFQADIVALVKPNA
jgi:hypothetical protein